jgi:hypothetical protein
MYAHRSGDPLTDADLDRELAAVFAVDPSPEFLARVRLRIGRETAPSRWSRTWLFAIASACAMAIAASMVMAQMDHPSPQLVAGLAAVVPSMSPAPLAFAAAAARGRRDSRGQKPTPEMRAVMNANAEASAALRQHLEEKNYSALSNDAETYRQNFAYLEGFWSSRRADGAVEISRAGLLAAASLAAAARARDDSALETAIAAIIGTCGACHRHYREELPDGSYEIRL